MSEWKSLKIFKGYFSHKNTQTKKVYFKLPKSNWRISHAAPLVKKDKENYVLKYTDKSYFIAFQVDEGGRLIKGLTKRLTPDDIKALYGQEIHIDQQRLVNG